MTGKKCRPFTETTKCPLLICSESLAVNRSINGNELFTKDIDMLIKDEDTFHDFIRGKDTTPDNHRRTQLHSQDVYECVPWPQITPENMTASIWIASVLQRTKQCKPLAITLPDISMDALITCLGIALTGRNIGCILIKNENGLKAFNETGRALELFRCGVSVISCPTCGRCHQELEVIVNDVKKRTAHIKVPVTVAVMGCEVNGPGEAEHADIGLASTKSGFILFKNGIIDRELSPEDACETLIREIELMVHP